MMEDTQPKFSKKKRGNKRRALVWVLLLAALALGLGFAATQGELDLSGTISTVREISADATDELRSTVDAIRDERAGPEEDLAAKISELEARVTRLEARSAPVASGDAPNGPSDKETRLGRRVEFELFSTDAIDMDSIDIAVDGGQVTLTGSVSVAAERVLAERIAEDVPGVTKVLNEIRVEEPRIRQTGG